MDKIDLSKEYDDLSIMHFGKHNGAQLGKVPISYFNWLWKTWDDEGSLKDKLAENTETGKLARYIRSARNAEKPPVKQSNKYED